MQIKQVVCKTALSASRLPGVDYSLNPYRGCQHNCQYCYVPSMLRIPRNVWGGFVELKTNIPMVLGKELQRKQRGVVQLSTVTDPYQPVEKTYRLTRYCLEQLVKTDFPVCIQTKSALVTRDLDLLTEMKQAEVMISIGTLDDFHRKLLEPNASSIQNRLQALQICHDAGVKTSVFFGPIYPTIQIQDIPRIVDTLVRCGVSEIMVDKFSLKPGVYNRLQQIFPKYVQNITDDCFFREIFEEIIKIGKNKGVCVVSAF